MTVTTLPNDDTKNLPPQQPAELSSAPRARRRWWQFSLRTMLVLVALITICTGFIVSWVHRSHAQRELVEQIYQQGGTVVHSCPDDLSKHGVVARWLEVKLGFDYVWSLKEVHFLEDRQQELTPDLLASLADYPTIEVLGLEQSRISDWTPISKITGLRKLHLTILDSSKLTNLSSCQQLRALDIRSSSNVHDVDFLDGLTKLEELNLSGSNVVDIQGLGKLTELLKLDCSGIPATDFSSMAQCTQLEDLDLQGAKIADIQVLAKLPKLRKLNCAGIDVSDFSPLARCTQLEELSLWQTSFSELGLLTGLTKLRVLNLESTSVADLEPIRQLNQLTSLNLNETEIEDYSPITACAELRTLEVGRSKFRDFAMLSKFKHLKELRIDELPIKDLSSLANSSKLKLLMMTQTEVTDLTPLSTCPLLENLEIGFTKNIYKLEPLRGLKFLNWIGMNTATYNYYGQNRLKKMFPNCLFGAY